MFDDFESHRGSLYLNYDPKDPIRYFKDLLSPIEDVRRNADKIIQSLKSKSLEDAFLFFKPPIEGITCRPENYVPQEYNENYTITSNSSSSIIVIRNNAASQVALITFKKLFLEDCLVLAKMNSETSRLLIGFFQSLVQVDKEIKYLERISEILVILYSNYKLFNLIEYCKCWFREQHFIKKYFSIYTIQILIEKEHFCLQEINDEYDGIKDYLYFGFEAKEALIRYQTFKLHHEICVIHSNSKIKYEAISNLIKTSAQKILETVIICLKDSYDQAQNKNIAVIYKENDLSLLVLELFNENLKYIVNCYSDVSSVNNILTLIGEILLCDILPERAKTMSIEILLTISLEMPALIRSNDFFKGYLLPLLIKLSKNIDYIQTNVEYIQSNLDSNFTKRSKTSEGRVDSFSNSNRREIEKTTEKENYLKTTNITFNDNPSCLFDTSNIKRPICFNNSYFNNTYNNRTPKNSDFCSSKFNTYPLISDDNYRFLNLNENITSPGFTFGNSESLNYNQNDENIDFNTFLNNNISNKIIDTANFNSKSSKIKNIYDKKENLASKNHNITPFEGFPEKNQDLKHKQTESVINKEKEFEDWTNSDSNEDKSNILFYTILDAIEVLAINLKGDFINLLDKAFLIVNDNDWIMLHNRIHFYSKILIHCKEHFEQYHVIWFKNNLNNENPRIRHAAIIGLMEYFSTYPLSISYSEFINMIGLTNKAIEKEKNQKVLIKLISYLSILISNLTREKIREIITIQPDLKQSISNHFKDIIDLCGNIIEQNKTNFDIITEAVDVIIILSTNVGKEFSQYIQSANNYFFVSIKDLIENSNYVLKIHKKEAKNKLLNKLIEALGYLWESIYESKFDHKLEDILKFFINALLNTNSNVEGLLFRNILALIIQISCLLKEKSKIYLRSIYSKLIDLVNVSSNNKLDEKEDMLDSKIIRKMNNTTTNNNKNDNVSMKINESEFLYICKNSLENKIASYKALEKICLIDYEDNSKIINFARLTKIFLTEKLSKKLRKLSTSACVTIVNILRNDTNSRFDYMTSILITMIDWLNLLSHDITNLSEINIYLLSICGVLNNLPKAFSSDYNIMMNKDISSEYSKNNFMSNIYKLMEVLYTLICKINKNKQEAIEELRVSVGFDENEEDDLKDDLFIINNTILKCIECYNIIFKIFLKPPEQSKVSSILSDFESSIYKCLDNLKLNSYFENIVENNIKSLDCLINKDNKLYSIQVEKTQLIEEIKISLNFLSKYLKYNTQRFFDENYSNYYICFNKMYNQQVISNTLYFSFLSILLSRINYSQYITIKNFVEGLYNKGLSIDTNNRFLESDMLYLLSISVFGNIICNQNLKSDLNHISRLMGLLPIDNNLYENIENNYLKLRNNYEKNNVYNELMEECKTILHMIQKLHKNFFCSFLRDCFLFDYNMIVLMRGVVKRLFESPQQILNDENVELLKKVSKKLDDLKK